MLESLKLFLNSKEIISHHLMILQAQQRHNTNNAGAAAGRLPGADVTEW